MMQRRMRWLAAGLLLAITTTASAETPALPTSLAAALAAADTPIARVAVPEPSRRVGEVRVHRHGGVRIVQTMLYTKLLERVVAEIARKEADNWPPEGTGHADAERYIAALREAAAMIPKPKAGDRTVDRRRKLLIEFVIDDVQAAVVFSSFEADEVAGEVRLTQRRPLLWLALSRDYVATNMDLIVADSFHLDAAGVAALWAKASGGGDETGGAPK